MLVVSEMLYTLLTCMKGGRDRAHLVNEMSVRSGRQFTPDGIDYLIEHKLRPLGLVQDQISNRPALPILSLAARRVILPNKLVLSASQTLSYLFKPSVLATLLTASVASACWLFISTKFGVGSYGLLDPNALLVILGLTLLGNLFHELGHAAAGTYSGATPGRIGVGIYLVWPAFYTDLTDSYRLSRTGRIRTDLGGIYFNLIFVVLLTVLYAITNAGVFLAAIVVQYLLIVQQFIPFLRLDGYYLLTDLSGVPDLFATMKSTRSSLVSGHLTPEFASLRPGVQLFVTYWTVLTTGALATILVWLSWRAPSIIRTGGDMVQTQTEKVILGFQEGHPLAGTASALTLVLIVIQVAGLTVLLCRAAAKGFPRLRRTPAKAC